MIANARFTGKPINIDFVREALRDMLALQEKLVTIDNIQKTVAEYYKIKVADLLSKRRSRSVARPSVSDGTGERADQPQLAGNWRCVWWPVTIPRCCMPAVKSRELREESNDIKEDYSNLIRTLLKAGDTVHAISISRDSLLRPLQLVSGSIGGRPTLPILSNVLLNVTEQRLSLTGTDLEVEMVGLVPLNGAVVAGNITTPARKLLDICRGLPDGSLRFCAGRRTF